MWNYTNAVHEHFLRPHNAGPMEDANAIGEVGSLACGDALKLYLKINDEGIIEKASFETFGCASAIASSSVLTDMVKGMKAEDALKLTNKEIAEALGGLPKEKMHCSVMGQEALEAAIRQWKGETPVPHAHEEGRLVCKCFGITDAQIIRAIRENGLKTVEEITNYTKAGGACGDCQDQIAEILAAELKQKPLTELLYSESASRLIVSVRPDLAMILDMLGSWQICRRIGTVTDDNTLTMTRGGVTVLQESVDDLTTAFKRTLDW